MPGIRRVFRSTTTEAGGSLPYFCRLPRPTLLMTSRGRLPPSALLVAASCFSPADGSWSATRPRRAFLRACLSRSEFLRLRATSAPFFASPAEADCCLRARLSMTTAHAGQTSSTGGLDRERRSTRTTASPHTPDTRFLPRRCHTPPAWIHGECRQMSQMAPGPAPPDLTTATWAAVCPQGVTPVRVPASCQTPSTRIHNLGPV